MSLPRPCLEPGCPQVARSGSRCEIHTRSRWPASNDYDAAWSRLSRWYRDVHPRCEWPGCTAPSAECDHVVPIRVDPSRRLDVSNLRALCVPHHRAVTARASNRGVGATRRSAPQQHGAPGLTPFVRFHETEGGSDAGV